jgi:NADH-quinone oxidoreductase subunit E
MSEALSAEQRDRLLSWLQEEMEENNHISAAYIEQAARSFDLSVSEVYGVATFYHLLSVRPLGRYIIRVCKSIPCDLKSSQLVIETIQEKLGIAPGETTPDGRFSLQLVNCIGACDQAPAMLLNHDLHGFLTPSEIEKILEACP